MPGVKWRVRLSSSSRGPRYPLACRLGAKQARLGMNLCPILSPERSMGRMYVSVKDCVHVMGRQWDPPPSADGALKLEGVF